MLFVKMSIQWILFIEDAETAPLFKIEHLNKLYI